MHPEESQVGSSGELVLNKNLRSLIFVNTMINFTIGMFAPFYAVFVAKIGGSAELAGVSWALFYIVTGVLILVLRNWELRVRRRHVLLALGYLIRSAVFLSYAFMDSIPQLLITQLLWGIGTAIGTPAFDALYTSSTSKETALVEWAYWEAASAIAVGLAALAGGFLIESIGYATLFILMAVISAVLGIYLLYERYKIKSAEMHRA
jgi:predicted MFS family arabinose efflux permease